MEYNQGELYNELSQNFIEYAAAVNTDRAIPNAKDGLKPVAKRILYGAYATGRTSNKPHVKCARIVGDVMGTYHPHGDTSIYGALVRLAQDWVMRYPLIDFHGNMGNIGGDGPAAHRYTEARLAKITEDGLLGGIKKENVPFVPNYDETTTEPIVLPAIFPNLLCNPNTGIGVAMACKWLPHNLREVAQAIFDYMAGLEPSIPGPDFPTGGLIINGNELPNIVKNGRGSVKVRARYKVEKQNLVFYEIPYDTTIEGIMQEIGELCDSKELEGISEIRDESNKKGIRIVIRCTINPDAVAQKLYAKTDLQTSISYNQVALVDKVPTELNLKKCIEIYLEHNIECVVREATTDLAKAEARKEVVEGLLKALEDIDNIIALIKGSNSSNDAVAALIEKYKFTENQAKAIVNMKLGSLAGLEKIELNKENEELKSDIDRYKNLMVSREAQLNLINERLTALVLKYGDDRRTEITNIEVAPVEKEVEQIIPEDVVVILSQSGDIKRVPVKSFKVQNRNTQGVKTIDNAILDTISTNTVDTLMFFTSKGQMYRMIVDKVPAGTNASRGVPIQSLIKIAPDEKIVAMTSLYRKSNAKYVVFFTKNGIVKKSLLSEYTNMKKNTGIVAIKLKENDSIVTVTFLNDEDIILVTKKAMTIRFPSTSVSATGRVTMGVKAINLSEGDEVLTALPVHSANDTVLLATNIGVGRRFPLDKFVAQARGGKGTPFSKLFDSKQDNYLIGAIMVDDTDLVLLLGAKSLCIKASDVSTTLGVSLAKSHIHTIVKI